MALDREKILQAAQKLVDKKRFDKAIQEYQRIIHQDPNDARTLLKIGDLQARIEAYAEAIATYDRVGQFYAAQGFALKAIAVYKQIRELIRKHAPQLEDRYGHITPKLAQIYTELGLTTDALAAYDEVAVRLQRNGRDRDAVEIFRKMVALDATNPLPHVRLAEACCRIQSLDEAIDSFWTAAELLIRLKRRDDALKVIERILHFRVDPRFALVAAELYLERGTHADGLQSLAKLQLCFQADPKNLDVLALLARAFVAIGQAEKSLEVKKEMARFAEEQGRDDVFRNVVDDLLRLAPDDPHVRALLQRPESRRPEADSFVEDVDVQTADSSIAPPPSRAQPESYAPEVEDIDFDDDPVSAASFPAPEPVSARGRPAPRAPQLSAPEVIVVDDDLEAVEEFTSHPDGEDLGPHIQKAIEDAESFRALRLYDKAIESLRIGLELDPASLDVREVLRDVLAESGDRDGTIAEMLTLAELYLAAGDVERASSEVYQVLEAEPEHEGALELLGRISGEGGAGAAPYTADHGDSTTAQVADPMAYARQQTGVAALGREAPLPSYDLEEIPSEEEFQTGEAAGARDEPALPSFELSETDELAEVDDLLDSTPDAGSPEVEEALDEAEFFAAQGLVEDARTVLLDALARVPGHPLVLERLRELERRGGAAGSGTHARPDEDEPRPSDRSFDIAASLDALDSLEAPATSIPRSQLGQTEQVDVDQVFAKFKEGVRAQVSDSDSSTHYDLGVAYKEMGLLPDAISEFTLAARDPARECTCYAMVGMIHLERGDLERAAEAYVRGLSAPRKNVDQEMSLYYDLGTVYEMKGATDEAVYYFQKISRRDPGYRDVKERLEALRGATEAGREVAARPIQNDDELEAAFDDLFESK